MSWRKEVDPIIKKYLEREIIEASKQEKAYKKAKDKSTAQLWCSIANLSKQIFDINLKLMYLEKTLQHLAKNNIDKKLKK